MGNCRSGLSCNASQNKFVQRVFLICFIHRKCRIYHSCKSQYFTFTSSNGPPTLIHSPDMVWNYQVSENSELQYLWVLETWLKSRLTLACVL